MWNLGLSIVACVLIRVPTSASVSIDVVSSLLGDSKWMDHEDYDDYSGNENTEMNNEAEEFMNYGFGAYSEWEYNDTETYDYTELWQSNGTDLVVDNGYDAGQYNETKTEDFYQTIPDSEPMTTADPVQSTAYLNQGQTSTVSGPIYVTGQIILDGMLISTLFNACIECMFRVRKNFVK